MANRKNNISDNEVKNASGGYVSQLRGSDEMWVHDEDTNEKIKCFQYNGINSIEQAGNYDEAYHRGKKSGEKAGFDKGLQVGFKRGFDMAGKANNA